ncbi:MAG TPA: hypothetical protein GX707_10530 [Epulopiscium sp.]|nr:hypothetical protein [Candidatus Epulonipiscium sp.]
MAYQICKRCNRMFEKNKEIYCKICAKKNAKDYELIIEYIRQHPLASVLEIVTATGAELKSVKCLIEDGSLSKR